MKRKFYKCEKLIDFYDVLHNYTSAVKNELFTEKEFSKIPTRYSSNFSVVYVPCITKNKTYTYYCFGRRFLMTDD